MKTIIRDKQHKKQTDWHQYPIIVGSICIHLSKYNHSLTKIRSMMSRHGSVSPWIKFHNIWNRKLNAIRHQVLFQMQESFVLQHNTVFTPGIMSRKETCVHEHLLLSPAPGERSGIPAGVFFSAKTTIAGMLFDKGSWIMKNSYGSQNSFGSNRIPIIHILSVYEYPLNLFCFTTVWQEISQNHKSQKLR